MSQETLFEGPGSFDPFDAENTSSEVLLEMLPLTFSLGKFQIFVAFFEYKDLMSFLEIGSDVLQSFISNFFR